MSTLSERLDSLSKVTQENLSKQQDTVQNSLKETLIKAKQLMSVGTGESRTDFASQKSGKADVLPLRRKEIYCSVVAVATTTCQS